MVNSAKVKNRCLHIVNVDWVLGDIPSEFIRFSVCASGFHSAPRHNPTEGLAEVMTWIDDYTHSRGDLDTLQGLIESRDGWGWEQRLEETLQRLKLDPNAVVQSFSNDLQNFFSKNDTFYVRAVRAF